MSWNEIFIGKTFIEVKFFDRQDSCEKILIPTDNIEKLEIVNDFDLLITLNEAGREEFGGKYKRVWVSFYDFCTDRNFYRTLQQTGKIDLKDKEIEVMISEFNKIRK